MRNKIALPQVRLNLLDKAICKVSPKWGLDRLKAKASITYLGDQGLITSGSSKRSMRGWSPAALSVDADVIPKLDRMRGDSRDLFYSEPVVRGSINRTVANAVGTGLTLQSRINRKLLGLSNEQADEWEAKTESEFELWANSIECDAERTLNFYDLGSLAFKSVLMSGDVFVAFPFIPRQGQVYDMRVKLIEADYCSNPNMTMDTPLIAGGIEVDSNNAPTKYWFRKSRSPFSVMVGPNIGDDWTGVPAYNSSGMRQVLHLFEKERPGQRRGIPMITPLTETIKQLGRYRKAEIDAAVINSLFTVFVKHITPEGSLEEPYLNNSLGLGVPQTDRKVTSDSNPAEGTVYEMGSANIIDMDKDEDIEVADPKHPVAGFDKFFIAVVKQIGSALGIPFEVLMLQFQSSYSASRAALNEAWKFFMTRRVFMGRYYCQPTYERWMIEAILNNRIQAPGFFADPAIKAAWLGSAWNGPGRGMIEPKREIEAAEKAITANLSTHEDEYTKIHGGNWTSAMERKAREKRFLEDNDLTSSEEEETETASTSSIPAEAGPNGEDADRDNVNQDD